MSRLEAFALTTLGALALARSSGGGPGLEPALELPLTPGAVALLVDWAEDPRVGRRWAEALADPSAATRAAAARAIHATGSAAMVEKLERALADETSAEAAREEMRALAALGGVAAKAALPEAAARLGCVLDGTLEEALARAAGKPLPHVEKAPARDPPRTEVRSVADFPPGFVPSLLEACECSPPEEDGEIAHAQVLFGRDGRPRKIDLEELTGPAGCRRALRLLFATSIAPARQEPDPERPEVLVAILSREFLDCLAEEAPGTEPPVHPRPREDMTPLKVLRQKQPRYPGSAKKRRGGGMAMVEAVISPEGCPKRFRLLRDADLDLALATFQALSRWRFEPARVDGRPVPVYLLMTTHFTLR